MSLDQFSSLPDFCFVLFKRLGTHELGIYAIGTCMSTVQQAFVRYFQLAVSIFFLTVSNRSHSKQSQQHAEPPVSQPANSALHWVDNSNISQHDSPSHHPLTTVIITAGSFKRINYSMLVNLDAIYRYTEQRKEKLRLSDSRNQQDMFYALF